MRVLAVISALVALVLTASPALAQTTCNRPATCPTNPAQVPLPVYSLTFDSAPASSATWSYNSTDLDGCGHTGLAVTGRNGGISDGSALSFVDLANTSSAQAVGNGQAALPSLGLSTVGGALINGTRGWTFETTFKPLAQSNYAKVFCLGNGAYTSVIVLGWIGTSLQLQFQNWLSAGQTNNARTNTNAVSFTPIPSTVLNQWYHVAVVAQQVDTLGFMANYFLYVNGVLQPGSTTTHFNIQDGSRPTSYLGRSCWAGDALFSQEVDAFRIYNNALNADQAYSLYAQQMGQCNITMTATPALTSAFPNTLSNATQAVAPVWGLNFTANPSSAVGSGVTPAYSWQNADSGDVSCGLNAQHQGHLVLAGGPNPTELNANPSWVNLTATTGTPNSVGNPPLPVLGGVNFTAGTVATSTAGMALEFTFKPALQETWAKLMNIGTVRTGGACNNDLVFGWFSNTLVYMNFDVCNAAGGETATNSFGPFYAGNWYHVVISMQQLPNGNSNWYVFINGQIITIASNVMYPSAAVRQWANLGRSNWVDATWSGWIDTFNIYNYALSSAQVGNLYTAAMGATAVATCPFAVSNSSSIPSTALYYDLSFQTNPNVTGQVYNWLAFDPTDSAANQIAHRGIVNISGCIPSSCNGTYINMAAASGPYSAGKVLGDIGGLGTGSIQDSSVGWSFEVTFKPYARQTWAKLFDIGNGQGGGQGVWEVFFGWRSTDSFYNVGVIFSNVQDYTNAGTSALNVLAPATPVINTTTQWYHAVIVMQYDWQRSQTNIGSNLNNGGQDFAFYNVYLDGQLVANSSGTILPAKVQRLQANLGKSNYGDAFWQGLIDTFRVYSIALNANQARALYQASLVQPVVLGSSSSSSAAASASSSSSASVTSVIAPTVVPVVNATSSSAASAVSAASSASSVSAAAARSSSSSSSPAIPSGIFPPSSVSSSAASSSAAASPSSSSSSAAVLPRPSSSSSSSSAAVNALPSSSSSTGSTPSSSSTGVPFITSGSSSAIPPVVIANGAAHSSLSAVAVLLSAVAALLLVL